MSPRLRKFLPPALIVAAVIAAVVLVRSRAAPPREEEGSSVPIVTTQPAEVRSGPVEVFGSGTVRPRAQVDLAMQVGGRVEYVAGGLVSGGRVAAGEVLVRVESEDYRNALEQATADVRQQEVAVLQADQEAEIARAEYEQFLARQRQLGAPVPDSVPSPLVLREPQRAAARAALDRARARLADAQLALDRTELRAPFDAVVLSEGVDVGSLVTPGQVLARIYASDEVEVVVPITDGDAALIPEVWEVRSSRREGRIPALVAAEFGGMEFYWDGYVDRAEAVLDERSRTVDVVVRVPRPFVGGSPVPGPAVPVTEGSLPDVPVPPLLVGQYAEVRISGRHVDGYAILPRQALQPGGLVWALEGSTVRIVPVRVLQSVDDRIWVDGDLSDGQPVVTGGLRFATDGMRVREARELGGGGES